MKLNYIDVLRGLAILGVLMVHCAQYGNNNFLPLMVLTIIGNGARGVQLFYIASAFTLFLSMNRRYENEKYPKINFFIRRFLGLPHCIMWVFVIICGRMDLEPDIGSVIWIV